MTGSAVRVTFPGRIIQYNGIPASKTAINTYMVYSPLCGLDSTRRVYFIEFSHGLFTDFTLAYRTVFGGLSPGSVSPFHGTSCHIAASLVAFGLVAHGFVAFGLVAHGLVAFGLVAHGFVAHGFVALGLVTLGFVAFGLVAFGLVAFGLIAFGLVAFGLVFVTAALVFVSSTGVRADYHNGFYVEYRNTDDFILFGYQRQCGVIYIRNHAFDFFGSAAVNLYVLVAEHMQQFSEISCHNRVRRHGFCPSGFACAAHAFDMGAVDIDDALFRRNGQVTVLYAHQNTYDRIGPAAIDFHLAPNGVHCVKTC
ncbi:hypothetical protein CJP46_23315 [Paenibacillus sp. XY044]|nr:hypothetical protein CJP46_23315 [Paenibacillus sp. XY044]